MKEQPEVMTVEQAAEFLQVSKPKLYRLSAAGEVPVVKVGRTYRYTKERLLAWLAGQPVNQVRTDQPEG